METAKLRSMIAAADAGSLSGAARRLGAQLSTVSRHIADVETEAGQALFVRTGRGVRLTPAGEVFVARVRLSLEELDRALAGIRDDMDMRDKTMRISTPVEMALSLMPGCLVEMRRLYPKLFVELHSAVRRVSLLEEDFHGAVRLGPPKDAEHVARPLGHVGMVVCAAPGTPAHEPGMDLTSLPVAQVAGGGAMRRRDRIENRDLPTLAALSVGTFTEAAEVASRSELVAILPTFTAHRYFASGQLARIDGPFNLPRVQVNLLLTRRFTATPELQDFGNVVRAKLQSLDREFANDPAEETSRGG